MLLAVHDYWSRQHRRSTDGNTFHDQKSASLVQRVFLGQHRYVLPTILLGITYVSIVSCTSSPHSTYICLVSNLNRLAIPLMQLLGLLLDSFVIINLPATFEPQVSTAGATKAGTPVFVAFVLLVSLSASICSQSLSNNNINARLLLFLLPWVGLLGSLHIRGNGYGCFLQARYIGAA